MDPAAPSRPDARDGSPPAAPGAQPDLSALPGPLRRGIDRFWALRTQSQQGPIGRTMWKAAISILGFLIIATGIILLPLPGPGWLIIFAGLGLWATEFVWAGRLLEWTKLKVRAATGAMLRWPRWFKGLLVLIGLAAVYPLWRAYQWVTAVHL